MGALLLVSPGPVLAQGASSSETEAELRNRIALLEGEVAQLREASAEREAQLSRALDLLEEQTAELRDRVDRLPANGSTLAGPSDKAIPLPTARETKEPAPILSRFDMSLYGYVKVDAIYNSQEVDNARIPGYVKSEDTADTGGQFDVTARQTRIGAKVDGPIHDFVETSARLEFDFYGDVSGQSNSLKPRMRLAWAELAFDTGTSVRFGRDYDTYITVIPTTVNFGTLGNVGWVWDRRDTIRLCQAIKLDEHTKILLKGAIADSTADDDTESPNFQWNASFHRPLFGEKESVFSVSGMYDPDSVDGANFETLLVMLSAKVPFGEMFTVQGSAWFGRNLGAPFHAGIKQGVNTTLGVEVEGVGGFAQVLFSPMKNLSTAVSYGIDDPDNEDLSPGGRERNQAFVVGLFYEFFEPLTGMFEYQYMLTEYIDLADGENHRLQGALLYKF